MTATRIRYAVGADRDAVVAMMARANLSAGFGPGGIIPLEPSAEQRALLFDKHVEHLDAYVGVRGAPPDAFLMAVLFAHPFDPRIKVAKDTAWWVEEGARGRLALIYAMLEHYEEWARSRGCAYAGMAAMASSSRVGKIYERRGYAAAETHYLKKL